MKTVCFMPGNREVTHFKTTLFSLNVCQHTNFKASKPGLLRRLWQKRGFKLEKPDGAVN